MLVPALCPSHPASRARLVMNSSSAGRTVLAVQEGAPGGVRNAGPGKVCPTVGAFQLLRGSERLGTSVRIPANAPAAARWFTERPGAGRGSAPPARPRPPPGPALPRSPRSGP